MTHIRLLALIFLLPCAATAQIEKIAAPTNSGIELQWWPKVQPLVEVSTVQSAKTHQKCSKLIVAVMPNISFKTDGFAAA